MYSTLAKRFAGLGYDVYYDKDVAARSPETIALFYADNPHFKGPTDLKPNAGYVRQGLFYELANRHPHSSIEAMERAHGLPPPYSIAPWCSYEPKGFHIDLSESVLVDFSAVSSKLADTGIEQFLRAMKGKFRGAPFVQMLLPKRVSLHAPRITCDTIAVESLRQSLDMMAHARGYVGSEAGGQSLAAIARGEHPYWHWDARPEISILISPATHNDMGYVYATSDYRATNFTQDRDADWHFPPEMAAHVYALRCALSLEQMRGRE